jgi:hypothetical protein
MADDAGQQAVEIIGALHNAGLLRAAPSPAEPAAVQVISKLREFGLLGDTLGPLAPPGSQPLKVDDELYIGPVVGVTKFVTTEGTPWVSFDEITPAKKRTSYTFEFPPNDESYLAEIDRIIAAPTEPTVPSVSASVKITMVLDSAHYHAKLLSLTTSHTLPVYGLVTGYV